MGVVSEEIKNRGCGCAGSDQEAGCTGDQALNPGGCRG